MFAMERVGSSAMKSLAAYADSDEEENEESKQSGDGSDMDDFGQRLDSSVNRHRTLSTAELAKAQLPEAPDSFGEDDDGEGSEKSYKKSRHSDDDEYQADPRGAQLISDDFDDDDDSRLVEPPPPARPKAFHSPSPSSSRGSTPQFAKITKTAVFPRQPSSQALVSYLAEDDDEFHQRKSLEKGHEEIPKPVSLASKFLDENLLSSSEVSIGGELSRPSSDRSHKSAKSEGTTDEIDVDELLEKPLEASISINSGVGSPADVYSLESIQIPPAPAEKCSEELQDKFRQIVQRKQDGVDFNAAIQDRTDFRNPSIYEKLIEHFGIDEVGTNFPKDVYDPHAFKPMDYYEEIGKAQRIMMEKLEKATDKDGNKPKAPVVTTTGPDEKKRKSRFDN